MSRIFGHLRPGWRETGRNVVDRLDAYRKNTTSYEAARYRVLRADGLPSVIKLS